MKHPVISEPLWSNNLFMSLGYLIPDRIFDFDIRHNNVQVLGRREIIRRYIYNTFGDRLAVHLSIISHSSCVLWGFVTLNFDPLFRNSVESCACCLRNIYTKFYLSVDFRSRFINADKKDGSTDRQTDRQRAMHSAAPRGSGITRHGLGVSP